MKKTSIINAALTAVLVSGGIAFANAENNVSAQASRKYNHVVHVRRTRVHVKAKHVYTSLSLHHRRRINSSKVFTYSKYIHFNKKRNHRIYKYVSYGKVHGWVNTKYVSKVKAAKHKKVVKHHKKTIKKSVTITIPNTKKKAATKVKPKLTLIPPYNHKQGRYVPNKENIKAEFKKLLDPYLEKYGKTYGTPVGKKYMAVVGDNNYGAEFVVTSGNIVSSDKEMAKTLFNGLLHGTLPSYLTDPTNTNVIIDHLDIDNSDGTTDARLYLTWYCDITIPSNRSISNYKF